MKRTLLARLLLTVALAGCPDDDDAAVDDDDATGDDDDATADDDDATADDDDGGDDDDATADDDDGADDDDAGDDDDSGDDDATADDDDATADDDDSAVGDDDDAADDDDSAAGDDDDSAAGDDDDSAIGDDDDVVGEAVWWSTCGDPLCSGWVASGNPLCTTETIGAACSPEGAACDPQSFCNDQVLCAVTDPKAGGCPISRRAFKKDIDYLDDRERAEVAGQILELDIARYQYSLPGQPQGNKLGFIIEDAPDLPAVAGDGVDLYTYASMLVATVQAQQAQIDALNARLEALEATCLAPAPTP